ncbi:DNA modification methylase [Microbacterium amylolyticum]|uniref:DNA modification methylase n=1 Tax=Microbacterium amylolyticum TaxID=936337 RepID=A0ABS4ZIT8_9MICO|nr:DNA modification methylase [Microbacterium amylolyticum]MBP2437204.1 hypothetical protein [Microbacterium amylolyticum]
MKSRTIASLALGGVVLLSAAGCGTVTPVATTYTYTAGDGINVTDRDGSDLLVRNAMIVATADGAEGNFVAALINDGNEAETLTLDWEGGSAQYTVPAGQTIALGADDEPLLLSGLGVEPGAIADIYLQSGNGDGIDAQIPVLNDCLDEYAGLAPDSATSDRIYCERYLDESVSEADH